MCDNNLFVAEALLAIRPLWERRALGAIRFWPPTSRNTAIIPIPASRTSRPTDIVDQQTPTTRGDSFIQVIPAEFNDNKLLRFHS
jgi:hypothetical protein